MDDHRLTDVVAAVVHDLKDPLRGHHIDFQVPAGLPLVRVDERLLHHILLNLLANAIQHGGNDGPIGIIGRRTPDAVTVTLISGKVRVDTYSSPVGARPVQSTLLAPGERFAAAVDAAAMVTPVSSEAATAWRRGQVMFNDTPLSAAVAELNRYGGPQVDIADPRLGALTVSGVFATNDTAEFADAVAALHGLNVDRDAGRVSLERQGAAPRE